MESQAPQTQPNQLKDTTATLMIGTALFFDVLMGLINFIPFLGQILSSMVGIFAGLTFWLWFRMSGIKFTFKKSATLGAGFAISLIPVLNMLPALTFAVTRVVLDSKMKKAVASSGAGRVAGHIGPKAGDKRSLKKAA